MAAGFIDPEPVEKVRPPRKQVLVVVTASWQVLCFDHNLSLMWEVAIEESLPPNARLAEVSAVCMGYCLTWSLLCTGFGPTVQYSCFCAYILYLRRVLCLPTWYLVPLLQVAVIITPHQVRKGNRGLVVVGGSMQLGDVAGAATGEAQLGDLMGSAVAGQVRVVYDTRTVGGVGLVSNIVSLRGQLPVMGG